MRAAPIAGIAVVLHLVPQRGCRAGVGLSAIVPAAFAAVVAVTRLAVSTLNREYARIVIVCGSVVAGAGAAVIAVAPSMPVALAGLVLAATGTSALFPTLLSIVSRNVAEPVRGRATSIVTVVSYLGFLLGPGYGPPPRACEAR
jgi:MFS family permease